MLDQAMDSELVNAPCTCAASLDKPALTRTTKITVHQKMAFIGLSLLHLEDRFRSLGIEAISRRRQLDTRDKA
jgi:hypothetical protein